MQNDPTSPNAPQDGFDADAVGRARKLLNETPEQIGPYRILETIGEGGMGVV